MIKKVLPVSLALVISACSMVSGPEYERPDTPAKSGWSLNPIDPSKGTQVIRLDWWTEFQDAYLNSLVEKALTDNITIQIAAARVEEAKAGIQRGKAARLPQVVLGGNVQRQIVGEVGGPSASSTVADTTGALNWELDIWGKLKKGIAAQKAAYHASEADWRGAWLFITASVAQKYFLIRQFDEQIEYQNKSLKTSRAILSTFERQMQQGLRLRAEVIAQKAEISLLQTQLLELKRRRAITQNELATLLGIPSGDFQVPSADLQTTVTMPDVPPGLPSDLLSRRPDIIGAEYNLLALHELVGRARLEKLPSIALTGSGGVSNLLSAAVKFWTFGIGPSINIPIFDPNVQATIDVTEAQEKVVENAYRLTVINAFQEVENALVNLYNHREQRREIQERVKYLEAVADLNRARLDAGRATQLEVFEVERSLLGGSQELLQNHQQILFDTITLYKALGGGWPPVTVNVSEVAL
jgi:multidrug efflux system outer membrane protein